MLILSTGSGKSKKDAKLNASKALLVHLHKVGFDPMTGDLMSTQLDNNDVAEGHSFADQIGQLVTAKYQVKNKQKRFCVGRESNPDQLLGRQLC